MCLECAKDFTVKVSQNQKLSHLSPSPLAKDSVELVLQGTRLGLHQPWQSFVILEED
jgi:hypothetical protein